MDKQSVPVQYLCRHKFEHLELTSTHGKGLVREPACAWMLSCQHVGLGQQVQLIPALCATVRHRGSQISATSSAF